MENNPYIKQFPDLMSGKKILYVHGFASSGQSGTVGLLKSFLPQATIIAPDLPIHPAEALDLLQSVCRSEQPDLIIGTSMGGMFTEMLHGFDRILVNPAFEMDSTLSQHTGKVTFHNPRRDGVQEFMVTKGLIKEYREVLANNFTDLSPDEQQHVYGLFGDQDPIVHTFPLFSSHYQQAVHFHGEHQLNDKAVLHSLIPVIRWINDKQEGLERPVVFIDFSTLHDAYGKATASMHKAYEYLIEAYNVFVVADAPSNDSAHFARVQQWVADFISVPAYNRVVFTNQKQLLYGDYLIDSTDSPDFLGTCIRWGSDDFKTWEEIITFFSRLGGQ